jgi:hypothetical protein
MSSQDQLFAKTAHLTAKKQEGLRERIETNICCSTNLDSSTAKSISGYILQQVIEWVDKEIIGEDENNTGCACGYKDGPCIHDEQESRDDLRYKQRQKLSQLKGELS